MLELRRSSSSVVLAAGVCLVGCGSLADATECTFSGGCGDAGVVHDTGNGQQDTHPGNDTRECSPGDAKQVDCNTCTCSVDGAWVCTKIECPDTGPDASPCPAQPTPGGDCVGDGHCIYTDPCSLGCDCVKGKWLCGSC